MALTITIPGAVEATIGATAPAVLTVGVGVPGATGPAGPGVPVGGTAGQFLTKIDGTNYNTDWTTVNLSVYAVKSNNLSDLTSASTARTNLGLGSLAVINDAPSDGSQYARKNAAWEVVTTTPDFISSVSSPLSVTTGNLTVDLSAYLTSATAASTYAVIAAGQPVAGSTGQVLTKNSGTNYDSSWATLIPGDRYLTTSTTSNTVSNGNKTFTIGTGLSYTPTQNITISYDASNHMHGEVLTYNSGTGVLTVDVNYHTGSGTYASWVVNVGGVTPATSVAWGAITGTLSSQTDLQSALDLKANLASPALTGNVTITSNSATAALTITQDGAGDILRLNDVAGDTTFTFVDALGKVNTIASTTASAGLNVAHGVAPTSPVNGDIWTTTTGLFMRQSGVTKQYVDFDTSQTINGNKTFSNATSTFGNSTATGTINVASGATISASTKTLNIGTGGVVGSTTTTILGPVLGASTTTIGATTAASTLNLATGATLTSTTKAVNIGTSGVAGSTTNIAIGGTAGTSTTTLNGTTNGITQTAGDSSLKLATTAFVTTADNLKANLASPTFTGTPSLPTGTIGVTQSPGNNTTALATTAFVTAAVPAFATETEAIVGTSSTTAINPLQMRNILANAGYTAYTSLAGNYSSYVSGSASVSTLWSNFVGLSVTAANGKIAFMPNSNGTYHPFTSRGKAELNLDCTKPTWFSFRFNYSSAAGIGDSNTVNRATIGKVSAYFGDLTTKGFGVKWTAGTTGAFTVMAHNGTTLTTVASAVTVSNTTYFPTTSSSADFLVYSDGTGNVTLFCNGVQVATTTGGPSSGTIVGSKFVFEADNTTSTSGTVALDFTGIRSMYSY